MYRMVAKWFLHLLPILKVSRAPSSITDCDCSSCALIGVIYSHMNSWSIGTGA